MPNASAVLATMRHLRARHYHDVPQGAARDVGQEWILFHVLEPGLAEDARQEALEVAADWYESPDEGCDGAPPTRVGGPKQAPASVSPTLATSRPTRGWGARNRAPGPRALTNCTYRPKGWNNPSRSSV